MFLEHPVTPRHARLRGDKSPILPPLTPFPSRRRESPPKPSDESSANGVNVADVASALHNDPSRSGSGAIADPSVPAAPAPGCQTDAGNGSSDVNSNTHSSYEESNASSSSKDSSSGSACPGKCESSQHRERLALLTAKIQREDQQQLRLTGVSVALAVGLFYLLLERVGLKELSLSFTFGAYIPLLHVLPALCAFCIVWLRLPENLPSSTAASAAGPLFEPSASAGLEEELLHKYVSTRGCAVVRHSERIHQRLAGCLLRSLVCLAVSDFFNAYVQFWPLLYNSAGGRSSTATPPLLAAERPAIFGPPPPGVHRKGFDRYPPEDVLLPQNSSVLTSIVDSSGLRIHAQGIVAVLTYLLRVLAAVWVLKAANTVAPGTTSSHAAQYDTKQYKRQQGRDGALDCLVRAAKHLILALLYAFLLCPVWRVPFFTQKLPSSLTAFLRTSQDGPASSNFMLVVGLLGLATLQLLTNALLPLLRNLRPASAAAETSRQPRVPVQQACVALFVAALLLEIFSTVVGIRAVFQLFMPGGTQPQLPAVAEAASKSERVLVCSAAVAHTLAAFVFASAGTCCSLQNYLVSKIFRYGKVDEQQVLGGMHSSY